MRIAEALSLEDVVSREDYLDLLSHTYDIFEAETDIQNSRDIQDAAALLKHRGETKRTKALAAIRLIEIRTGIGS